MNKQLPDVKTQALVKKWIDDMVKNGFMSGWLGDRSDEFKKEQFDCLMKVLDGDVEIIGGNYRLLATIHSDYHNLKQYCGWSQEDLFALLELFGFKSIEQVVAVMNCPKRDRDEFMEHSKLKKEVKFFLTPKIW